VSRGALDFHRRRRLRAPLASILLNPTHLPSDDGDYEADQSSNTSAKARSNRHRGTSAAGGLAVGNAGVIGQAQQAPLGDGSDTGANKGAQEYRMAASPAPLLGLWLLR
jgi:hypothetical protein